MGRYWRLNDHFGPTQLEECSITKFKRAQVKGGELVLSEAYESVSSLFSHFAVVDWPDQGLLVARIKFFCQG